MSKNDINSNFNQIAVTDGTDAVLGIRALATNIQMGGSASTGQGLVSTGTTTTSPLGWVTLPPIVPQNWTSETLTVTAIAPTGTSINPTLAAGARNFIKAVKIADKTYSVEFLYYAGAAGVVGNGVYMFKLPGGLQFDTTVQPLSTVNSNSISTAGWNAMLPGSTGFLFVPGSASMCGVVPQSTTTFKIVFNKVAIGATNTFGFFFGSAYYGFAQPSSYFSGSFTLIATT